MSTKVPIETAMKALNRICNYLKEKYPKIYKESKQSLDEIEKNLLKGGK